MTYRFLLLLTSLFLFSACNNIQKKSGKETKDESVYKVKILPPENMKPPLGMVWVPGGSFVQGAVDQDKFAMNHEKPKHKVIVDGFFMDITEVTNRQFEEFVEATGYKTVAERGIDWNEMKNQVPAGTLKPADSILQPGSLTFLKTDSPVQNLGDFTQWWRWTIGANWKHPQGPDSSIEGHENHPVVHIAYEDALAYCKWAGRRLPTEAEWELAARAGAVDKIYYWGNSSAELVSKANTWTGTFPYNNTNEDNYTRTAPVGSYPANANGLYDMAGNVWEWTNDWYNTGYYRELAARAIPIVNPQGALSAQNPNNPYAKEKVIKGGSFLCNASYCSSYRISARMATTLDSSAEHIGFRTVWDGK